jgi:hypothetical protein
VVILSFERLTTLTLSARVITDLMKGDRRVNDRESNGVTETDEVKVLEEFGIIELFLKRQSGARETGDKDDRWFGGVTGSMGPDLGTVLGPHEVSERGHDKEILVPSANRLLVLVGRERERSERYVGLCPRRRGTYRVQKAKKSACLVVMVVPRSNYWVPLTAGEGSFKFTHPTAIRVTDRDDRNARGNTNHKRRPGALRGLFGTGGGCSQIGGPRSIVTETLTRRVESPGRMTRRRENDDN